MPAPPAGVKVALLAAVLLNCAAEVEGPETTVHAPVPVPGTLAARVTFEVVTQIVWSVPALEAVGAELTVTLVLSVSVVPHQLRTTRL